MTDEFRSRFPVGTTLPFAQYMDVALYDESVGFYSTIGRAGRRGDFLTSPEVGPLCGALIARRLDEEWLALGSPETFVVVEFGAGPGTLARSIAFATPECGSALRYLMVERSSEQRAMHADHLEGWMGDLDTTGVDRFVRGVGPGPQFASSPIAPYGITGVILANELLDNLVFDIVRHDGAGNFERLDVHHAEDGLEFVVAPTEVPLSLAPVLSSAAAGEWMPLQEHAVQWLMEAVDRVERGVVIVIDYGATTAEIAARSEMGWLRTFVGQERGGHPLDTPGSCDITTDVAVDQLGTAVRPTVITTQQQFLERLGIAELVEEGRQIWTERASAPDVAALRARSRVGEAEALLELGGLGDFVVLEWTIGKPETPEGSPENLR
ncbi:MAG: SAM-dependent methyltransferase [Actinomycetota bacterium]